MWSGETEAAEVYRGTVLWWKDFGQPLVFAGKLTGLKKSPYRLPSGTFQSLMMLLFDTGFRAVFSEGEDALFLRSSGRLLRSAFWFVLSLWRGRWLVSYSHLRAHEAP